MERGRRLRVRRRFADDAELEAFLTAYEGRCAGDRERLDAMLRWAETTGCRVQVLRRWFGEPAGAACGRCDGCRGDGIRLGTAAAVPRPLVAACRQRTRRPASGGHRT